MGEEIHKCADLCIWPKDNRALSPDVKWGSFHTNLAVADGKSLYIFSAKFTDYAMNLNMEMGILIQGGSLPNQVEKHFEDLINQKTIVDL